MILGAWGGQAVGPGRLFLDVGSLSFPPPGGSASGLSENFTVFREFPGIRQKLSVYFTIAILSRARFCGKILTGKDIFKLALFLQLLW